MARNPLSLFCVVDGEATSNAFSVEIERSKTANQIKDVIKAKNPDTFNGIDAKNLTLWRVMNPNKDDDETPILLDNVPENEKMKLGATNKVSIFGAALPEDTIHVIVQRPPSATKQEREDGADDRDAKRHRSHITAAGPVQWHGPSLMLPFPERSLSEEVRRGICAGNSFVVHELSWANLMTELQALSPDLRHYVLVDEFQWVFGSSALLSATKKFFRKLLCKKAVSYVAVGTFKFRELLLDNGSMESPFNKAHFARMPPFDLREMSKLFDMYKENCDPVGISRQIQCRPDESNWTRLLQEYIGPFFNGTQAKLRKNLKSMTIEQRAQVRNLTTNRMSDIEIIDDEFTRYLFNIGVLDSRNDRMPQPKNRLSREEIGDPINVLKLELQCISPSTIVDPLVRNKFSPQDNDFQVALFSALSGLLPIAMKCLFEARAKDKERIDLVETEDDRNVFGYELKVNAVSQADFKDGIEQASRYAKFYSIPVYLANFYPEGHSTPARLLHTPANVAVINVKHNKDCTRFIFSTPDGHEITVNTNDSLHFS
ncbi:hypothetical protein BGW38_005280 [Lunasporangiospora selenospora]|uniref:Crinkler effector protein N-terminal domain-containing protein n=1 Tax=Lunasporangiospora selenospora TaxID=979761 RepID=A0A9P6FP21_9FUNG|nr:hypothetical protein BGW38_005280 [Lunasporangiospora selenospora]